MEILERIESLIHLELLLKIKNRLVKCVKDKGDGMNVKYAKKQSAGIPILVEKHAINVCNKVMYFVEHAFYFVKNVGFGIVMNVNVLVIC